MERTPRALGVSERLFLLFLSPRPILAKEPDNAFAAHDFS
jgi:hypothetical protein